MGRSNTIGVQSQNLCGEESGIEAVGDGHYAQSANDKWQGAHFCHSSTNFLYSSKSFLAFFSSRASTKRLKYASRRSGAPRIQKPSPKIRTPSMSCLAKF